MKKILVFILFLQCIGALSFSCTPKKQIGKLAMIDTVDFGMLNYEDTLKITHKVYNPNDYKIKIEKIAKTCKCIEATVKDSVIYSKDSGQLFLVYNPKEMGDSGKVVKFVSFRTNAEHPIQTIFVSGTVIK